jgi:probable rRNA maturation factor
MNDECRLRLRTSCPKLITISITNRQRTVSFDRCRMRHIVEEILTDAGIAEAHISLAIVDDATIADLHNRFLDDPTPTDVLSFLLEQSSDGIEGEIVVSAETALACAAQYGCTPQEELLRYVIHGTLHLVGYDDVTPRKRAAMRREEDRYLSLAKEPAAPKAPRTLSRKRTQRTPRKGN